KHNLLCSDEQEIFLVFEMAVSRACLRSSHTTALIDSRIAGGSYGFQYISLTTSFYLFGNERWCCFVSLSLPLIAHLFIRSKVGVCYVSFHGLKRSVFSSNKVLSEKYYPLVRVFLANRWFDIVKSKNTDLPLSLKLKLITYRIF